MMPHRYRRGFSPCRKSFFRIQIVLMVVGVLACEPSELRPAPVGFPNSEPAPPARSNQSGSVPKPRGSQPMPMIDNPDAEVEHDSEEVWATDEYDAQAKCEQIAQNRSGRSAIVSVEGKPQKLTKRPSKSGNYRFLCRLKIEHQ